MADGVAAKKDSSSASDTVGRVLQTYEKARTDRGIWERHWEDVAQVVLPYYSTSFFSMGNMVPGQERGQNQFDVTANVALFRFAAAMESMLTPRNGLWHRIRLNDKALLKSRRVQLWCDQVNDALFYYRYAPAANFSSQQHDGYVGIGAFGTSCLFIDSQQGGRGLRYRNVHLGEVFLAENHQGIVDKLTRRFKMTIRQIAQKWGEDQLPDQLKGRLQTAPETQVFVIHHVEPRTNWDQGRIDAKAMRFASYYVVEDTRSLMAESGYREFPYATSRYITAPNEIYGRSPAMQVLPAIKTLNEITKTMLKQAHRAVDPVLLAHDDGVIDGFSLKPGAINAGGVNAEGRQMVQPLPVGEMQIGQSQQQDNRQLVNDAFLVSLFQILVQSPQMTATEVLERAREKGALLSPTMGRFQSESQGPQILREYNLLMRQGAIPPPPPELIEARAEWHVEYDAPLNRAMRAEQGAGIQRTVQFAAEIAGQTQNPEVMDWFNFDAIIPDMADISGAPFRYMNGPQTVMQLRKARQQQQETAQVTQALPGMAAMMQASTPKGDAVGQQ